MPEAPASQWRAGWWSGARACPSPNFGQRPAGVPITLALLHSISLPPGEYGGPHIDRLFTNTLDWDEHPYFQGIRGLEVSSHFVISRLGIVTQYVSCDDRAWHAGRSTWEGRDNCNDWSIGIELEGLEGEVFEPAQYVALDELLLALAASYPIESLAGHEHVAPGRKLDPGPGFNWNKVGALIKAQGWRWPAGVLDAD
ncbi:1,6-anhydro-N-acetylmuramyl-L-alanine amidase AmpD [Ideonella margarita]|uniref:1,6-anhydro-N-acetylmuramyl-L-alanine amidase AmpD n=1 Tax=Ideonella margarita TaxID=2984191 RepID=A0ABU9BZC7_9BURK